MFEEEDWGLFQSPSRDSGGLNRVGSSSPPYVDLFQSPSRDSGGLNWARMAASSYQSAFQSPSRDSGGLNEAAVGRPRQELPGFNPPVGILVG